MTWKPKPRADVDLTSLPLDSQEGFLLSRLDGSSDVAALAKVTGFPQSTISSMLLELVAKGAIESPNAARPLPARVLEELEAAEPPAPEAGRDGSIGGVASAGADPKSPSGESATAASEASAPEAGAVDGAAGADSRDDLFAPIGEDSASSTAGGTAAEGSESADAPDAVTHRALYEQQLHPLSVDYRTAQAKTAEDPFLSAYCFDQVAAVAIALLENPRFGLAQARLVARHHHTGAGLEALASKAQFAADDGVRRALLRNHQMPAAVFRRIWSNRRLAEQYLVATSREATEGIRSVAKELLRTSFAQRVGDEKAELITATEGRCLVFLAGLPLDAKATAILCRRTYVSSLFIQNLARWSATPPQLVAHLRRQEIVKRTPQLRQLLERHPNA